MNQLIPRIAIVGLSAAGCFASSGAAERNVTQSPACSSFVPGVIGNADGFTAYVETPQLAREKDGLFLVGSPAFAVRHDGAVYQFPGATQPSEIGGARIGPGNSILLLPKPSPASMANPRLVTNPAGRVNVLWIDGDSLNDPQRDRPLMWSEWLGSQWSRPDSLPGTENSGIWRQNSVSPPVAVGSTVFLVATFGVSPTRTRAITWRNGKWSALPMPGVHQSYLSFAASGDTLVAVYVDYGAPDGNAVYAQRSADRGGTFLPPVRVSRPGSGPAIDARVLRGPGGRLIAVWVSDKPRPPGEILSAYSDDGGRSWEDGPSITPATGINSMRAAATTNGKVVVIAQVGTNRRQIPTYFEWKTGAWSKPMPLIRDSSSSLGIASIYGGDSVVMVWSEYAPRARRPVTKYVVLPESCQPPESGD